MLANCLKIEFARDADSAEIADLSRIHIEHGLHWRYTPARIRLLMRDKSKNVIVARVDGVLLGFGIMTYRMASANLDLLAVSEACRRQGVATQIVQWLEKVAVTAGIANIYLQVRHSNTGAIGLYRKLGFQVVEELQGYYQPRESCVVMCRGIQPMFGHH